MANDKKYPLTVIGLYSTSGNNSRSGILRQIDADKACAAIQAAVGGKLAVRATRPETKKERGDTFPDYFLEAVTPEILAEERVRMAELYPQATKKTAAANTAGDSSL